MSVNFTVHGFCQGAPLIYFNKIKDLWDWHVFCECLKFLPIKFKKIRRKGEWGEKEKKVEYVFLGVFVPSWLKRS